MRAGNHSAKTAGAVTAALCMLAAFTAGCTNVPTGGNPYVIPAEALRHAVPPEDPEPLPEALTLEDLYRYAALNNPGLEAAFNQWAAAMERIPQARSLPDPMLQYTYFIEEVETRVGPQRHRIGLAQTFPWFGTLRLRGDVTARAAESAWHRYQGDKLMLFERVAAAAAEVYYIDHAVSVTRDNMELVRYLERVARTRYAAAGAGHPSVIKAQVELGKLTDRLATLRELRPALVAKLNAVLGRSEFTPLPALTSLPEDAPPEDLRALLDRMARENPQLKALAANIERSRSGIALAKKQFFPDITLGLSAIETGSARAGNPSDSGKDPVLASVGLNLPIWLGKYRAAVREQEAQLRKAQYALADRANTLAAEVHMALYRAQDAQRKIGLYKDTLVPLGEQNLKATETAFRGGTADFLSLIDAQRMLLEFQLEQQRATADRTKHLAMLDRLIGREIPRPTIPEDAQ